MSPATVPKARRRALFSMPAHRAFSDALAKGLLKRFGGGALGLGRGIVLLPSNRAVEAVQAAFVRQADGGLLLPRLVPIGDLDLDERIGAALDPIGSRTPLPRVVDPLQRQLILARLVQQAQEAAHRPVDAAEAMRLAQALAATLDQLQIEQLDPHALTALDVADDLQSHWRDALALFDLVVEQWPGELARIGCIDLAERRNRLLEQMAESWRTHGSQADFICAAGIASTAPAVAGLLSAVADLSQGLIVFADLDLDLSADEWTALGEAGGEGEARPLESHPQYHLKRLLDRMGVHRDEIEPWPYASDRDSKAARGRMVGHAFAPPRFTAKWQGLPAAERSLAGISAFVAANPAEEAQLIALSLRETLETPGKTAALITPDRGLAERVVAHLKRWDINADDSAGRKLSTLPAGTLPVLLVEAAASRFAPVPLLALLKHPLVMAGDDRGEWLGKVRALDLVLRGPRTAPGLEGIAQRLVEQDGRDGLCEWWGSVSHQLTPLEALLRKDGVDLPAVLDVLVSTLMQIAGNGLWSGVPGRALADLFNRLTAHAGEGPTAIAPDALAPLIHTLLAGIAVRPPIGGHPRLFIWGLIEAQLQRADRMILGGLNEGIWPALPSPDPWLAPGIRRRLGLPGLESRIGLAAHDFAGALAASEVMLTRSRRDASGPAVASRFWLRLAAMAGAPPEAQHKGVDYRALAWKLDATRFASPVAPPAPKPPKDMRPTRIAITDVDRLKADPFAFYAKAILGLRVLEAVDADPTAAWKGTAVHAILEAWSKSDDHDPDRLRARARELLRSPAAHSIVRAMWAPRLLAAIDWIADQMTITQTMGREPWLIEVKGAADIAGVTLHGRADRIDRFDDGSLAIVDYKTGVPPSPAMVASGYAMQLGLVGAIAERGGFDMPPARAAAFEYWSLAKDKTGNFGFIAEPFSKKYADVVDPESFVAMAIRDFTVAAERWLTGTAPFIAKLQPELASYADYDQLMRLEEWYGRERSVVAERTPDGD